MASHQFWSSFGPCFGRASPSDRSFNSSLEITQSFSINCLLPNQFVYFTQCCQIKSEANTALLTNYWVVCPIISWVYEDCLHYSIEPGLKLQCTLVVPLAVCWAKCLLFPLNFSPSFYTSKYLPQCRDNNVIVRDRHYIARDRQTKKYNENSKQLQSYISVKDH